MPTTFGRVRSALFTPGSEGVRLRKAVAAGADVCIFDLEDSVPIARVAEARETVRSAIEELSGGTPIWVRVHAASSHEMPLDLAALPLAKIQGVMLPKASHEDDVSACHSAIVTAQGSPHLSLVPIIENAAAVLNIAAIARSTGVFCLALGRFDLSAELGIDPDSASPALAAARAAVVLASAAARVHPPLDSPWLKIKDFDGLRSTAKRGRADGFGGMLLIHPTHVPVVNGVFDPTPEEIAWARDILASAEDATAEGHGAYRRNDQMV
ncbi:MAG: CoA ester lyase, partial [Candidatus Dormibacteraeota bacterium]|nr:CoA ester lyase [Candidatus Dormibacteraeota bacterium]